MNLRRLLLVVVAACVVLSVVASVGVVAQSANETGNETATENETVDPTGNASGNATGNESGTPPGLPGSGGGSGFSVTQGPRGADGGSGGGPAQAAADFALGPVFSSVLDVPVLEIGLSEPGPIHPPDNWPYSVLFPTFYVGIFAPITLGVFLLLTFWSFGTVPIASLPWFPRSTYGVIRNGIRALLAILGGIVFHLTYFAVLHDLADGFVSGVAPSPGDMIAGMGLLQFSLATAVTGMGLYELGWDMVKWIGVSYGFIWFYLAFFPMFSMPLTAWWLYKPQSWFGRVSAYLHILHLACLFSKCAVAVQLFAASTLDWGANFDGLTSAFLSLALIGMALVTPLVVLVIMIFSKGKMMNMASMGAGAMAGSTLAAKARESDLVQKKKEQVAQYKEQKTEEGKSYSKRKAAAAQGKYWDVKNRAQTLGSVAAGSAGGVAYAGKERFNRWRSDEPGVGSSSKTAADGGVAPTRSERMRRFEEMNERAGGLTDTQRKRYFNLMMEDKGKFDSGLNNSDSPSRRNN